MPFVVKGLVDAVGEIFILFRMIVYVYYTDFNLYSSTTQSFQNLSMDSLDVDVINN